MIAFETVTDVVVVGTGAAGLTAARGLARAGLDVLVITKSELDDANTTWAQGGVAVVLDEAAGSAGRHDMPTTGTSDTVDISDTVGRSDTVDGSDPAEGFETSGTVGTVAGSGALDTVDAHVADTLAAAAGLADPIAVDTILSAGPAAVTRLRAAGAAFDADPGGVLLRTREGGHHADRVIHAGGDATGAEIERALLAAPGLPVMLAHHLLVDIVPDDTGSVAGVLVLDHDHTLGLIRCGAVVLATGGSGQLFAATTNPAVATGDGLAVALRAGAALADAEFVQFHPTMLYAASACTSQRPLVTEAVRGAGAVLVDGSGQRIMPGVHPLADLAPRDVVSLAITRRLAALGGDADHVYLDASMIPAEAFAGRFPTVTAACLAAGIVPGRDPIPVAPGAHYQCGGVLTDLDGRSSVPGLYAAGEVARTGLHGANRLASNSLLEGVVMGERVAAAVEADLVQAYLHRGYHRHHRIRRIIDPVVPRVVPVNPAARVRLQATMSRHAGIGRDADGLAAALSALSTLPALDDIDASGAAAADRWRGGSARLTRASVETANLLLVARAMLAAAVARTESRGCHVRTDRPALDPGQARSVTVTARDGELAVAPLLGPSSAGWRPDWADARLAVAV